MCGEKYPGDSCRGWVSSSMELGIWQIMFQTGYGHGYRAVNSIIVRNLEKKLGRNYLEVFTGGANWR